MSTNDYKYSLLDAEELDEQSEETPGVTAEEGTEEEETKDEVTV